MGYTSKKIPFNPPRNEAPSLFPTNEAQARHNLETIENMIAKEEHPSAFLLRRRDELKKELEKCDTKRQAHARALWKAIIEKRQATIEKCTLN